MPATIQQTLTPIYHQSAFIICIQINKYAQVWVIAQLNFDISYTLSIIKSAMLTN